MEKIIRTSPFAAILAGTAFSLAVSVASKADLQFYWSNAGQKFKVIEGQSLTGTLKLTAKNNGGGPYSLEQLQFSLGQTTGDTDDKPALIRVTGGGDWQAFPYTMQNLNIVLANGQSKNWTVDILTPVLDEESWTPPLDHGQTPLTATLLHDGGQQLTPSITPVIDVIDVASNGFRTSISVPSSTNVVLTHAGPQGLNYYVLCSTNLTLPISQWTPIATNTFSGDFDSITDTVSPSVFPKFYMLEIPNE